MEILSIQGDFTCPICGHEQAQAHIEYEIYDAGISMADEYDEYEETVSCSFCKCLYVVQAQAFLSLKEFQPVALSNKEKIRLLKKCLARYIALTHLHRGLAKERIKFTISLIRDIQGEIKNGVSLNV
jgi:hypothetical protein